MQVRRKKHMPKRQLHWSAISMLQRCGVQYEFRYLKNIVRPPAVALIVGSGTHKSIDCNLENKRVNKKLLPLEKVKAIARDDVNARWEKEGVMLDEEEKSLGEANVRGEAVDTAVTLAELHHTALAPDLIPLHVERKWVLEIGGYPFDLAGTLDVQEVREVGGAIRDTKTSAKSPPANAADTSDQLTCYALAVKTLDHYEPPVHLDYLVKTKTPKTVSLASKRTGEDYDVFLNRVAAAGNAIEKGVFIPAPQDDWCCSRRYCGWFDACPYARKKVQI